MRSVCGSPPESPSCRWLSSPGTPPRCAGRNPNNLSVTINPALGVDDTLLLTAHPECDGKRGFYWSPAAGHANTESLSTDGQVLLGPIVPWLDQEWHWNYSGTVSISLILVTGHHGCPPYQRGGPIPLQAMPWA